MPSPIAHGFAGFAVAHFSRTLRAIPERQRLEWIFWIVALVFAANAADLDFLAGFLVGDPNRFHHGPTHALIAPVVFALLTAALARFAGFKQWHRFGMLMGLSYATHLMLDFVTVGTKEPYGMKLLWPFSHASVMPPFHIFMDIRRDPGTTTFLPSLVQWHNAKAIALELAIALGVWALYWAISSLQFSLNAPGRKTPPRSA